MVLNHPRAWLLQLLGVASAMAVVGCGSDALDAGGVEVLDGQYQVMSFEEYRDRALREADGQRFYVVEFDLIFSSEDDLYDYYVQRVEEALDKSTAILNLSTNERVTWVRNGNALNIRYCVSDMFGPYQSAVEADVAEAMHDWENIANLHYVYDASQNGDCMGANENIDVAVIYSYKMSQAACGQPPYLPPGAFPMCPYALGTLAMDYESWRWPWMEPYPNITPVGVFRHELGHINGLRHEHLRAASPVPPSCEEQLVRCGDSVCTGPDYLTDYDFESVMHYPQCGDPNTAWDFTALDVTGVQMLYGMPAAWYIPFIGAR